MTRRSRTLASIQREPIRLFVVGMPSRNVVKSTGVKRNAAILSNHKRREINADGLAEDTPFLGGDIDVDETTFGGRRKGKGGRGEGGKVPVFGLRKRSGKVNAVMVLASSMIESGTPQAEQSHDKRKVDINSGNRTGQADDNTGIGLRSLDDKRVNLCSAAGQHLHLMFSRGEVCADRGGADVPPSHLSRPHLLV